MIDIETVEIGQIVVYTPSYLTPGDNPEFGIVTSKNDTYIFVKYGRDFQSKATRPRDLTHHTAWQAKNLLLK